MKNNAPFGYEWKDGELIVNKKESEIVKWIFNKSLKYAENPPEFLIQEVMDSKEKLSYDEARSEVPYGKVQIYLLAELKVRIKWFEDMQAEPNEIKKFLEDKLDEKLTAAVGEGYRKQEIIEHAGGFIPLDRITRYVGKIDREPMRGLKQVTHKSLISKGLYESAVKKIQESRSNTSEEKQDDNFKQGHFFERMDALLPLVDLYRLDESCNSEDDSYAKEILKKLHDIFVDVYGTDYLENSNHEFVVIPAVIKGRETGHIGLGIIELDLESSREHWRTYFLTPRGVIERHQEEIYNDNYNYITDTYIPYDYWYTATIERDIHVDFENVPEKISSMLDACYTDHPEMKME